MGGLLEPARRINEYSIFVYPRVIEGFYDLFKKLGYIKTPIPYSLEIIFAIAMAMFLFLRRYYQDLLPGHYFKILNFVFGDQFINKDMKKLGDQMAKNLPNMPELNLPNMPNMPKMPEINMPSMPKMPEINMPNMPSMPTMPKMPKMPEINLPNIPNLSDLKLPGFPKMPSFRSLTGSTKNEKVESESDNDSEAKK